MGSSAIFNGAYVKLLKDQLKLKDSARILTGTDDPTSVAKEGETGSIYLKQAVNTVFPETFEAPAVSPSLSGSIYELATYNNEVYAGGSFPNRIAKFNGTSWASIGLLNSDVLAFAVHDGSLYIGGSFTDANSISGANYIVRWDGTAFSRVGGSGALNGRVNALYSDGSTLYIGGEFTNAGSVSGANYIAKWDGTTFSRVGGSGALSAQVRAITAYNSSIYIGGQFTNAGSVSGANYITRWDGTTFYAIGGSGAFNATVRSLAVYNSNLYIGGDFSNASGITGADYIAKWNNSSVTQVGPLGSFSGVVAIFALQEYSGNLYIGGFFTNGGIAGANYIVRWDETTFSRVGGSGAFNSTVEGFTVNAGKLYIGGGFTGAAGVTDANGYLIYTDSYTVNTPAKIYTKTDNGTTTNWKELVDTFNDQTIGGDKTFTGNMSFTGTLGNTVIDVDSATNALRVTQRGTGNALLVEDSANPDSTPFVVDASGNTSIGADATVTGILKLGADARIIRGTDDPTSVAKEGETGSIYLKQALNTIVPEAISALGTGINSNTFEAVECIAVYNNEVYVGGSFTTANGAPANYLAKWNGTSWVSVGTVNNRVVALKVYNNELYLGGNFTNINGVTGASYLAKWNGTTFSTVGGGSNFFNTVVAFEVYNNELYIGGYFTGGGGVSGADYIVKYNGSTFSLVGPASSLNSQVRALAVYGSDLYIGGNFTNTGGFICVYFVRWNGSAFSVPAGNANAFNGQVLALAVHSGKLYIGGGFTGNVGVRLVSWNGTAYATLSGTNLNNEVYALISHSGSLYIGGNFSDAFGITGASDLVRYDGTSFYAVGAANAFNSTYGVLAFATNNSTLYIGGYFNNVNGAANTGKVVSYVPSYTISAPAKIYTKTDAGTTTNWKELVDTFNDQTIGGNKTFTGLVNSLTANQDRGLKMIEGGVWTYSSSSPSNQVTNLTGSTSTLFSMSPTGANNSAVGQSFTPSSAFIPSSLVVSLLRLNNPTGNVRIDIYNDNAGTPGSVIASSNEILASSIATSATDYTFTFSTPVLLSASTLYYFMLVPGAGYTSDSNNNIRTAGATSNVYAGGQVVYRQNNTGTWVSYAGDTRFNIIGYVQQLSFTATAYIQVPGLPNVRNTITTAQSPISIANGQAAYVNINRTGTASSNLTVSVANIDSIDATNGNLVIIARGTSDGVFVGTSTDKLAPGQSSTLESIGTILANVTTAALKVTQTGTGDAILVEDQVSDTTPFVVKADGKVGIGTASPAASLTVSGDLLLNGSSFQAYSGTIPKAEFHNTSVSPSDPDGGTVAIYGTTTAGADLGAALVMGSAYSGTTLGAGGRIRVAKENSTSGDYAYYLALDTRPNLGNITERVRITSDGNVGIGTASPSERLHVNGNGRFDGTGAVKVPSGTTGERPGTPINGMIRYNSETTSFEGYASNAWSEVGGSTTKDRVTQASHNFAVGDVLYINGSKYAKADASNSPGPVNIAYSYTNETVNYGASSPVDEIGARFKPSSTFTLSSITIPDMIKTGTSAVATVGMKIYQDSVSSGTPSPSGVIATSLNVIPFNSAAGSQTFNFTPTTLNAGSTYLIVVYYANGTGIGYNGGAGPYVIFGFNGAASLPENQYVAYSGGNWSTATSIALNLIITEPSGASSSEVVGVVSRIIDANTFDVTLNGEVSGLLASNYTENALPTVGEAVFLSTTAGKLTITEPSTVGEVSLPIGVASGSGTLYVFPKRGAVVGGANARTLVGLTNNTSTSIQLVTAYDAGELTGWVNLPNSTPANSKKFYVQVQFAKNGPGTDYNVAFQTTGDTPPAGFNIDYSGGYIRVTLPNVSGLTNASINFALNAPAVGATLPLAIDSENVMFGTVKPKDANGINVRNFANTATNLSIADTGVVSFFNAMNFDYMAVTSATTLNTTHYYVSASGSTTYAITLPTAVGVQGRVYIVKSNMNAGVLLTVNTTSSQTIDGATSRSLARFESLQVISNGSNWEVF